MQVSLDPQPCYYCSNKKQFQSSIICEGFRELLPGQLEVLEKLLDEETPSMPEELTVTYLASHVIYVQCLSPIKQNYLRYSSKVLGALRNSAEKLEREGLIKPSDNGWCNPVVMAKKPVGELRL